MDEEQEGQQKVVRWARRLMHEYPEFSREGEDGEAPEPDYKMIGRAISKAQADEDSLKNLGRGEAIRKIVNAPGTYNKRLRDAYFGKTLCDTIRERQAKMRLY